MTTNYPLSPAQQQLRATIVSEAVGLSDAEDLALRTDDLDFEEGIAWGLSLRLAELRGITHAEAQKIIR